ncbi:MAG: cytochrome c biogenesis protein ResB, partial [Terriglobales bacterium]
MHDSESDNSKTSAPPGRSVKAVLASVKLTVACLTMIAATVLLGAWCPQESAVGQEKIIEQFGEQTAMNLIQWGIADIFHTPFFLALIGMLTLNMIACSFQRVFPKIRLLKQPLPVLGAREIGKLPYQEAAGCACPAAVALDAVEEKLRRQLYKVSRRSADKLTAEFGKFSRLAATITHIGLLT